LIKTDKIPSIELKNGKKAFFASDVHLGLYPLQKSRIREKLFVKWLDEIKPQTQVLFLLGDIFDFWFEYNKVVPRGFTRFLGKLAEFTDSGIEVHFFAGNHDVWIFDYLAEETGVVLHKSHVRIDINGKQFLLGHGDGLSPDDKGYRFLKACFTNKFLQFLFARLHPNLALWFGQRWSKHSRLSKGISEQYMGDDKEHQIVFSKNYIQSNDVDFLIFGHRHYAMDYKLSEKSRMLNLGEWIFSNTFASFDGENLKLETYK
jgi:UDP-2,3-diacylglucosamine hydrolase